MNFAARHAISGFIRLPEPSSSFPPHFEGQRSASLGTCQDCAGSAALPKANNKATNIARITIIGLIFSSSRSAQLFAISRATFRIARATDFTACGENASVAILSAPTKTSRQGEVKNPSWLKQKTKRDSLRKIG